MKISKLKKISIQQVVWILMIIILVNKSEAKETIYLSESPVYQHKIAVVTNRTVLQLNNDSILFESTLDANGLFSYITASFSEDKWSYTINKSMEELLKQDNGHENWVIFIHGDGKNLKSAIQRAKEIQVLHQVNVIVYAWPAQNPEIGAIKNFKNSRSNVEKATINFSEFLQKIEHVRNNKDNLFSEGNLSMFFHSLGNYYLQNIVENNLHLEFEQPFITNLIINAAAVEQKQHNQWVERLKFQKRIYINSNGKDMNLIGLRIFSSMGMQLGEDPEPPLASNAFYVNFTDAVGASLPPGPSHSYFFASVTDESERIKTYFTEIINGFEVDFSNKDVFRSNSEYLNYSIIF